jgi:hypothetical protein
MSTPSVVTSKPTKPRVQRQPKRPKTPKTKKNDKLSTIKTDDVLKSVRQVASVMSLVEHKELIPPFRGRDAPNMLTNPHSGYVLAETKESLVLRDTFRTLFGDRIYPFRLSTALNMSSSAGGVVNSTISNSVLVSQVDFVSLATVFNEFFIQDFEVRWMPNGRYQFPLTGLPDGKTISNLPIGSANLQHGQAAYSSLTTMSDNYDVGYHSTGDPFSRKWINTENSHVDTMVASLTAPTQSWCPVNNASNYQGTLQFLSQSAPPGLPVSSVLGTFMVHFHVLFRVRA